MGKFSIKNNNLTKTIESKVEGIMSVSDAINFIAEYKKVASSVSTNQYRLILDCKDLAVSPKESQIELNKCFDLYKQANYKEIVMNTGNNPILKMQLTRIAQTTGIKNFKIS